MKNFIGIFSSIKQFFFFKISLPIKEWRYKKKYGISMDEAMRDFGKNVRITEIEKE